MYDLVRYPRLISNKQFDNLLADLFKEAAVDDNFPPTKTAVVEDELVVQFALAGYTRDQLKVSITGNALEVSAEKVEGGANNLFAGRAFTWVRKDVRNEWALDKARVTHENGMLTVTIPKKEELKPKFLPINS